MLALYGMLRCFVETQVPQDAATVNARRSFFAACDVVDAILVVKNQNEGYRAVADALQSLAEKHMAAHVAAYGTEFLKPKSHWSFDIAVQAARDYRIFDAFALERMHLRVKRVSQHVKNTTAYERSVAIALYAQQRALTKKLSTDDAPSGRDRCLRRQSKQEGGEGSLEPEDRRDQGV